ncbi:MAG: rRNA maturation RNase YbeY [Coriobacteriaceae bacterium]|nr:rRNA maturation RNase YbeY [Coriobacteriaceae bacterium]
MAVSIANEAGLAVPVAVEEIEAAVDAVLAAEGVRRACEVSVAIVTDEEIRELNRDWRGIDAVTDVLSFECDSPFGDEVPAGEVVEVGDVILAPGRIAEQAPRFGGDAADEFRLMLVHGVLHLLGHDHMQEGEALAMEARELEVLRALARARGDDQDAVEIGPTTRHIDD